MKRQLLSAVLSTATLGTSCAAAFAPPTPRPFICSTVEIGQGQKACESLLLAIKSSDIGQYKQADSECRRITGKLRVSFGETDYEDAYQQAVEEVWKRGKASNIYRRIEWRCLDLVRKRKRLRESPHEVDYPRKRSTLLSDTLGFAGWQAAACHALEQVARNCVAELGRAPAEAALILNLWCVCPDAWYYVGSVHRKTKGYQLRQIEQRLGLSRKQAERGLAALLPILQRNLPKDLMS